MKIIVKYMPVQRQTGVDSPRTIIGTPRSATNPPSEAYTAARLSCAGEAKERLIYSRRIMRVMTGVRQGPESFQGVECMQTLSGNDDRGESASQRL